MQIDQTTLTDLSIFHHDEEQSVFHFFDHTQTVGGKAYLKYLCSNPLHSIESIEDVQKTLQSLQLILPKWPTTISNGTIMVIEKFFETPVDHYPPHPNTINSFFYRLLHAPDYSITKYSVKHFIDFINGFFQLKKILEANQSSKKIQFWVQNISRLISKNEFVPLIGLNKESQLSSQQILHYANFIRNHFKHAAQELIELYSILDAYLSVAKVCEENQLTFPSFKSSANPYFQAEGLFHLLLETPVAYDLELKQNQNFLFLTGANMAGKSTFIKAVGLSAYLAHLGFGVPAKYLQLSLLDGLLSNIHVSDNLIKGESYFFNEVQRIKKTIEKINDGKLWLILIDELFKGTNVQDAMKCSTTVIEGLHKMQNAIFILSTHLYEIGEGLQQHPNIVFKFFETHVSNDQLVFNYHLKDGISSDRLGYLILKREGVVDLLNSL